MTRVLVDFHHTSLLTSLVMLFEDRLNMDVYRPIGMEWFYEGYWKINDQKDTATQFLSLDAAVPKDGTPPLNKFVSKVQYDGEYFVLDPGGVKGHRACTLKFFQENMFDYVVASIPAHVPIFEELIARFQPQAKLIVQMGNNWDMSLYSGKNVLASTSPQLAPGVNAHYYHQEFDTKIFMPRVTHPTKRIHSYVNVLANTGQGLQDFLELESLLAKKGFIFKSYGGQNRDGNMNGPRELANSMHEAEFILHSKPGGDGYGHIIHNAYSCGRPVIIRPSQYRGQLAEQLFAPGTFINLDKGRRNAAKEIAEITSDPDRLFRMGKAASEQFKKVVDFAKEAQEIKLWLKNLQ